MASAKINDPPAAKEAPRSTRDFPGLVQLLSRQASGFTDCTAKTIKEGITWKPGEVIGCEPASRRR